MSSWRQDCFRDMFFSERLRGELDNEVKQQALFKLLGQDYVTMYFRKAR